MPEMIRAGGHVIGEHGWEPFSEPVPVEYDPADYKVNEVKDHVGDDKTLAAALLELERRGKNRVSLVEALEEVLSEEVFDDQETDT